MRTRKAYTDTSKRRAERHTYWFKTKNKKISVPAKVKAGSDAFFIDLSEAHVLESARRNGEADGHNCAGAVCADNSTLPFAYTGYPDFQTTRAYFSTRNNKLDFPTHCVVYAHDAPFVAKLFDTDLNKLTQKIRKAGGKIRINFFPVPLTRISAGRNSGSAQTTGRKIALRGHKLRLFRSQAQAT